MVSLTPEAQHRAVEIARGHAVELAYWPIQDPTLVLGSREAVMEAYREARDAPGGAHPRAFRQASDVRGMKRRPFWRMFKDGCAAPLSLAKPGPGRSVHGRVAQT